MTVPSSHQYRILLFKSISLLLFIGSLLTISGIVILNPHFLESYVISDHHIADRRLIFILYCLSSLFFLLGIACIQKALFFWRAPLHAPLKPFLARCLWVILSVGLLFAAAELWTRVAVSPEKVLRGEDPWRYEWLQWYRSSSFKNKRADRYLRVNECLFDIYHPTLGWVSRPNYRSPTVNTNSRGLRGKREYRYQKRVFESRIIALGDSFTFGEDVRDNETYPFILQKLLKNTSVLNFGVHGYGTDQAYLYLKTEGFKYSPDLVILGIFVADPPMIGGVYRNTLSFRDYAKPYFLLKGRYLVLQNLPVPPPNVIADSVPPPMPMSYLWSRLQRKVVDRTIFAKMESWRLTTKILDQMLNDTREHKTHLLVATIPLSLKQRSNAVEFVLDRWARENGVPILHLRKAFLTLDPSQRAKIYEFHWTPFGNKIVAELVKKKLVEERLIGEEHF